MAFMPKKDSRSIRSTTASQGNVNGDDHAAEVVRDRMASGSSL
jgi:hypothetical protein